MKSKTLIPPIILKAAICSKKQFIGPVYFAVFGVSNVLVTSLNTLRFRKLSPSYIDKHNFAGGNDGFTDFAVHLVGNTHRHSGFASKYYWIGAVVGARRFGHPAVYI